MAAAGPGYLFGRSGREVEMKDFAVHSHQRHDENRSAVGRPRGAIDVIGEIGIAARVAPPRPGRGRGWRCRKARAAGSPRR